jgi:hypothetical protein
LKQHLGFIKTVEVPVLVLGQRGKGFAGNCRGSSQRANAIKAVVIGTEIYRPERSTF